MVIKVKYSVQLGFSIGGATPRENVFSTTVRGSILLKPDDLGNLDRLIKENAMRYVIMNVEDSEYKIEVISQ